MKRFAPILALVTALCIGWVPVFAAPARLAAELETHHMPGPEASQTASHLRRSHTCAELPHCGKSAALHPAVCSACTGIPLAAFIVSMAAKPKIVIPRGRELPLMTRIPAPLHRPPRP